MYHLINGFCTSISVPSCTISSLALSLCITRTLVIRCCITYDIHFSGSASPKCMLQRILGPEYSMTETESAIGSDSDCLVTLSRNSGGLTNLAGYRTRRHRVLRASSWVLVELLPCDSILFVGRFLGALDNQGAVVAIRVREAHIDP